MTCRSEHGKSDAQLYREWVRLAGASQQRRSPQRDRDLGNGLLRCTVCGEGKPHSEFYPQRHGLYGRQSRCKTCHCAYNVAQQRAKRQAMGEAIHTLPDNSDAPLRTDRYTLPTIRDAYPLHDAEAAASFWRIRDREEWLDWFFGVECESEVA